MTAGAIGLFEWEYVRYATGGRPPREALAEAQTMAVTSVILFQVFYMTSSRSLRDSIARIGFFSNPFVFVGIAVLLLLQAGFVYLEPLQRTFGTAPLSGRDLLVCLATGVVIQPVIAVEKWVRARLRGRRPGSPGRGAARG